MNKNTEKNWIYDAHQDIIIACLFTNRTNFFDESSLKDGSNDMSVEVNNQSDLPRLIKGNVRAVFASSCAFSMYKGEILPSKQPDVDTYAQINGYHRLVKESKGKLFFIKSTRDLSQIHQGKLGFLLHVEGADMLAKHSSDIETLFNLGVRSIGLTWNNRNGLAGGCLSKGGLTIKGKEIIRKMEDLGVIVDLAHLNRQSTKEVLKHITKPCIVSHTNCTKIYGHPRNLDDEMLKAVATKGGVVCISGVPSFVGESPTIEDVYNHIVHAVNVCGEDGVGIGSDFSVMTELELIPQYQQSSDFDNLIHWLQKKLKQRVIEKICNKNVARIVKSCLKSV